MAIFNSYVSLPEGRVLAPNIGDSQPRMGIWIRLLGKRWSKQRKTIFGGIVSVSFFGAFLFLYFASSLSCFSLLLCFSALLPLCLGAVLLLAFLKPTYYTANPKKDDNYE